MAKQLTAVVKLQCPGGTATPAPPVGPALGAHGVNIGAFVKQFNERTADRKGMMLPILISVYSDRSFDFVTQPPTFASESRGGGVLSVCGNRPDRRHQPPNRSHHGQEDQTRRGRRRCRHARPRGRDEGRPGAGEEGGKEEGGKEGRARGRPGS